MTSAEFVGLDSYDEQPNKAELQVVPDTEEDVPLAPGMEFTLAAVAHMRAMNAREYPTYRRDEDGNAIHMRTGEHLDIPLE
jgi:hypothetical protein